MLTRSSVISGCSYGNTYSTIQIADQCWVAENLKVTSCQNGVPIDFPHTIDSVWQSNTTGAYAWQENDIYWKDIYGALYNWFAVNNPNGLCPAGWHVPNNDDWNELTDFTGGIYHPNGNKLKTCRQIGSPLGGDCNTEEHPRWEWHSTNFGTDDFSFSALPGGFKYSNGSFSSYGVNGGYWSASSASSDNA